MPYIAALLLPLRKAMADVAQRPDIVLGLSDAPLLGGVIVDSFNVILSGG